MKLYVAKIVYYNISEDQLDTDYICIAGDDFVGAMETIENYYGKDLDTVELEIINDENPFVLLPDFETYEKIRLEGDV